VSNEIWLVHADALRRDDALGSLDFGNSIDQQKWVAMRQDLHDFVDVESCGLGVCGFGWRSHRGIGHGLSRKTPDYTFRSRRDLLFEDGAEELIDACT
jgi:hypothetical protein